MPALFQTLAVASLDELAAFARRLAPVLDAGDTVLFDGNLGAGKTTLIKDLCQALGCRDAVTSPTYTIAQLYHAPLGPILHLDAYRLNSSGELWDLGYDEEMETGLTLIEWGQKVADDFPDALRVELQIEGDTQRQLILSSESPQWHQRLQTLEAS